MQLTQALKKYEEASGQLNNVEKSSTLFSTKGVAGEQKEICREIRGIKQVNQGKYLGLPMVVTRAKEQMFEFIKDNE